MKDFRFVFRGLFAGLFIFLIIAIIASLSGPDKPKKPYVPAQRSTTEKPVQKREPVKAKVPPGTFVNEQAITFNDLNIGEEILLCEGSRDYCRQVFDNYTQNLSPKGIWRAWGDIIRGKAWTRRIVGSIASGWILGNGYEIILSFSHANAHWEGMGVKPKTTISMLKF